MNFRDITDELVKLDEGFVTTIKNGIIISMNGEVKGKNDENIEYIDTFKERFPKEFATLRSKARSFTKDGANYFIDKDVDKKYNEIYLSINSYRNTMNGRSRYGEHKKLKSKDKSYNKRSK